MLSVAFDQWVEYLFGGVFLIWRHVYILETLSVFGPDVVCTPDHLKQKKKIV